MALEAGAVGVGGLVAAATLDLSGLVASGLLAVTGLMILPYQQRELKKACAHSGSYHHVAALSSHLHVQVSGKSR